MEVRETIRKISLLTLLLVTLDDLETQSCPYFSKLPPFSISEILDKVQEDAEDVLFSLGFGQEDHKDTSRIPARFFTTPSQAKGIDFQLFLKAQVRRIEMEDPCLMLASEYYLRSALCLCHSQQGAVAIDPTSSWSVSPTLCLLCLFPCCCFQHGEFRCSPLPLKEIGLKTLHITITFLGFLSFSWIKWEQSLQVLSPFLFLNWNNRMVLIYSHYIKIISL